MLTEHELDVFERKVDRSGGPDACHPWKRSLAKGYGQHGLRGKNQKAHRVAFLIEYGRWPEPLCCHKCDNPVCCNPRHLFEGTVVDNNADRDSKGRGSWVSGDEHYSRKNPELSARGERHGRAKLSAQTVRDIVAERLLCRTSNAKIARDRGLSPATVDNIMSGKNWSSVTGIGVTR